MRTVLMTTREVVKAFSCLFSQAPRTPAHPTQLFWGSPFVQLANRFLTMCLSIVRHREMYEQGGSLGCMARSRPNRTPVPD